MPAHPKTPRPELVAFVRRRYAAGAPVSQIVDESELSLGAVYQCIDGVHDDGSGLPVPPLQRRKIAVRRRPSLRQVRATLVGRLWRSAESQMHEIEKRLEREGLSIDEREGDARVLAIMVRTIRELRNIDGDAVPPAPPQHHRSILRARNMSLSLKTSKNSVVALRKKLTGLPPPMLKRVVAGLPPDWVVALDNAFWFCAHDHQQPPEDDWTTWLVIGGRGSGKTRAGAEWVKRLTAGAAPQAGRIALIGETEHDVREVMIEGVSGLLAITHRDRPKWIPSRRRLEWDNGAVAYAFSAEDPERLRGPQFHAAWCDELAKWRHAEATFDMLQFGLRLGERPRQVITTTPRPIPLLKRLLKDESTVVTHARTQANAYNLAPAFIDTVLTRYAGTRLGRQEIDGEIIDDRPDALWSRALIEQCRVAQAPPLQRVVVAVDPPGSSRRGADACGIVAAGRAESGTIYVLEDASAAGLSPSGWASKAVALYRRLNADSIVVEVNMGGEMVRAVLREVDSSVPLKEVHATRGKWLRAEPVAALYEQGKAKHVGAFPALEDEMCDFGSDGLSSGRSPDRLDALVWAATALTEHRAWQGPRITVLDWGPSPLVPLWRR